MEQMREQPYEQTVGFAIMATFINYFIARRLISILVFSNVNFANYAQRQVADGITRGLVGILSIIMLGKIIQSNGFKFAFTARGFKKGMVAHIPMLLCIISLPFIMLSIPEARLSVSNALPSLVPRAIFDVGNSVWEEVLWRGVLMTGVLIGWSDAWDESDTVRKRVKFMLICSLAFGLIHYSGGGWIHVAFASLLGTIFSAAYIYSRNLLSCTVVHFAVNYITQFVFHMFVYDMEPLMVFIQRFFIVNIVLGVVVVIPFTIYITIKAEPFCIEERK